MLTVIIVNTVVGQFKKPGDLNPEGSLVALEQLSQLLVGGWGGEAQSHSSPRVMSPLLRCVGPIMESSFLSLQNIMGPLPCSSQVHLGLFLGQLLCQGRMAWELVKGPPVPIAHSCPPPLRLPAPASQPLTHQSTFLLPLLRCCGRIERGTFAYSWSQHHG